MIRCFASDLFKSNTISSPNTFCVVVICFVSILGRVGAGLKCVDDETAEVEFFVIILDRVGGGLKFVKSETFIIRESSARDPSVFN